MGFLGMTGSLALIPLGFSFSSVTCALYSSIGQLLSQLVM